MNDRMTNYHRLEQLTHKCPGCPHLKEGCNNFYKEIDCGIRREVLDLRVKLRWLSTGKVVEKLKYPMPKDDRGHFIMDFDLIDDLVRQDYNLKEVATMTGISHSHLFRVYKDYLEKAV